MVKLLSSILCFMLIGLRINAQQKIVYPSKVLEATFEISKNAKVKNFEVEGKQAEVFMFLSESKEFEYTLTVTKSKDAGVVFKDFKEDEYKNSYLESCSCTIEGEQEQSYGDFKTYQFSTITKANGQALYGLVDNLERNGDVFAFVYLTTLANYEIFKHNYREHRVY